jgi:hypothetical protein
VVNADTNVARGYNTIRVGNGSGDVGFLYLDFPFLYRLSRCWEFDKL